ncbi:hypothetical protein KIL84_005325 [Mauremys mutica]|uniref:Uncharacterized protein n=1 Tax=Mauremys mutica TaxID=74926 RepID=A0A9D3XHJ2_9SAUR|nr:hypothetical protein KIL84_005325 [Mauremys mutica]
MDGLFGWDCEGADLVLAWQSSVQQWSGVWKHMPYSVTSRLPSTIGTNFRSLKSMSANVCEYGVYSVQIQPRAVAWKLQLGTQILVTCGEGNRCSSAAIQRLVGSP